MAGRPGDGDDVVHQATRSLALTSSDDLTPGPPGIEVTIGETVGRYQVRRAIGRGGMGQVYLARDIVLGRSVALKLVGLVHGAALSTERFLHEARAVARLNHPHIVQLYDFGEYRGGFYLALEYIAGDTLRERARGAALPVDEVLRLCRAIADGLCHAHDHGVYHCDLKPSNVMVGKDGRVRVVGVGVARTGENAAITSSGTPDWMAPEQWSAGRVTDRVDSWALGILTAQLLTGRHPLGDDPLARRAAARNPARIASWTAERRDVPAAVVELVTRSLEREPALRPSAAEWARVLDRAIVDGPDDAASDDGPFRGLAAFDAQHARFYFGRELEVDAFVERLRDTPQLPIVGPSGAGKSSFLHAGVIPRLRARGPWTVIALRPGPDPIGALARRVAQAIADDRSVLASGSATPSDAQRKAQIQAFRAELVETPTLLAARLATLAQARGGSVLLAVDQLEEVFTQGASEADRQRFLQMLACAVDDPGDPVRVVVTVRDDFVGKLPGLGALFVIKRLAVDDIRRTITGPVARYDYQFDDPAIVDDLIAEVGSAEAANLPLLSFACRTLWDGRDPVRRRLLRATYREMGGLGGALGRHADHALAELSADERRAARQLLLQLVVGTTRRSVPRDHLVAAARPAAAARDATTDRLADDTADRVVDRLLAARLLVQRGHGDGDAPVIELAHESLVHTWSQLARWLDESREELRLREELGDAARLWQRRGQRIEDTWSAADLAAARHRAAQLGLTLPPPVEAFFAAGDQRNQIARRRRRIRVGVALATASAAIVLALLKTAQDRWERQQFTDNTGTVDFVLAPFDWVAGTAIPVMVHQLPDLTLAVYSASADDADQPGPAFPDERTEISSLGSYGPVQIRRVRAPGGMVFLRIDGRGRTGQRCPASWIRVQAFPGYRASAVKSIILPVPTCQAALADMRMVDAGPFIFGGAGEPRSPRYGEPDYTEPERSVDLPAFLMDRTEVSNAAFAQFSALTRVTGYAPPLYSIDPEHARDADRGSPVSDVDAISASAYCAYLGKHLPSDFQWVKAARGGQVLRGRPNPAPRRLYPWGHDARPGCVNRVEPDQPPQLAPVDAFACGASPYGIVQLVGNVQEWISRDGQTDRENPLHALRGGSVDSPADQTTTIFRNHRQPRRADYSVGLRCVVEGKDVSW